MDRTLLAGKTGLEQAKKALVAYKQGEVKEMTPELWAAKKIVDSTLHPGGESCPPSYGWLRRGERLTGLLLQTPESRSSCRSACPASSCPTWS